jgi:hypothetical protein
MASKGALAFALSEIAANSRLHRGLLHEAISKAPCPTTGRTSPLPGEQGPPAKKT